MENEITEIQWSWDHPIIQEILLKYYRNWLFNTPEIANKMVEQITSLSNIQPPHQVLDIGCGLGYHAIEFAKRGFRVFAFDPGDKYIEIAKNNNTNADVFFKVMTCSGLETSESYALAWAGWYCPGQLSPSEVVQDFKRIHDALIPGGWFISNVAGKQKIYPMKKVRNWQQLSDCFALSEKWADETHFHEYSWFIYPQTNKVIKIVEVEKMYGVNELTPLLAEAGFIDITTAKDLTGKEPAQKGEYFAFYCRKKE
ncbi:MAG: class I SAM-dependent methyltransferase [Desulfobacteraceae bacterium]|nr:class I SAM-dependent methyltransferase [Desulfobacteraceae bacterium]